MNGFTGEYLGFDFYIDIKFLLMLLLASILGSFLRLILIYILNQKFLNNTVNAITYSLLPPVGFLITNIISSSIALSLGMVGALSIVRFRTPVKNPSELVYYFMLITIGIVLNVNGNFAVNFIIYVFLLSLILIFGLLVLNRFDTSSINLFSKQYNYLNIETLTPNPELLKNNKLKHISYLDEKYILTFKSRDKNYLINILEKVEPNNLVSYSLDFETDEL